MQMQSAQDAEVDAFVARVVATAHEQALAECSAEETAAEAVKSGLARGSVRLALVGEGLTLFLLRHVRLRGLGTLAATIEAARQEAWQRAEQRRSDLVDGAGSDDMPARAASPTLHLEQEIARLRAESDSLREESAQLRASALLDLAARPAAESPTHLAPLAQPRTAPATTSPAALSSPDHPPSWRDLSLADDWQVESLAQTRMTEAASPGARLTPRWVPNDCAAVCACCASKFKLVRRRHHCRACGDVFCGACSRERMALPNLGYDSPVRICTACRESASAASPDVIYGGP